KSLKERSKGLLHWLFLIDRKWLFLFGSTWLIQPDANNAYIFRYWEIIIILIMMQPAVRSSFDCFISEKAALKCFFICIP
ncbi:hypothetical protein ACTQ1U_14500, partial [Thermoguttaceae bacterium LCP21S3_D4]